MIAVVAVVAVLAPWSVASPAGAHDDGPVQGSWLHKPDSDWCSGPVIDFFTLWDTVHACIHHDTCWQAAREGNADPSRCDVAFNLDLIRGCDKRWPHWYHFNPRGWCYYKATVMYNAVVAPHPNDYLTNAPPTVSARNEIAPHSEPQCRRASRSDPHARSRISPSPRVPGLSDTRKLCVSGCDGFHLMRSAIRSP